MVVAVAMAVVVVVAMAAAAAVAAGMTAKVAAVVAMAYMARHARALELVVLGHDPRARQDGVQNAIAARRDDLLGRVYTSPTLMSNY